MFLTAVRLRSWTNLSGLPAALQAWSHALRNVPSCSPGPDLRTRVSSGGGGSSGCARGEGPRPCLPELTVSEWGGRRARGPHLRHGSMAMSSDPCPRPRGCSFQPASAEPHDRIFTSAAAATHGRHAVRHQSPRRRACLGGSASTPADERGADPSCARPIRGCGDRTHDRRASGRREHGPAGVARERSQSAHGVFVHDAGRWRPEPDRRRDGCSARCHTNSGAAVRATNRWSRTAVHFGARLRLFEDDRRDARVVGEGANPRRCGMDDSRSPARPDHHAIHADGRWPWSSHRFGGPGRGSPRGGSRSHPISGATRQGEGVACQAARVECLPACDRGARHDTRTHPVGSWRLRPSARPFVHRDRGREPELPQDPRLRLGRAAGGLDQQLRT